LPPLSSSSHFLAPRHPFAPFIAILLQFLFAIILHHRDHDLQVPIISFLLDGIDIDIGFSQTNLSSVDAGEAQSTCRMVCPALLAALTPHLPSDFVACDAVIENMDKRCRTSINGLRVTDAIASLLPQKPTHDANIDVFRTVIRFLKHWAKRRCVYVHR
jgi:poly(A) polymerase Pap1